MLHVLPGLGGGGVERMASNLMRTLDRRQLEAGLLGLLDPPFGTDLEETLAQDEISVWHPGKRQGFDPQTFAWLVRVPDRVGPNAALSLHLQGSAQRAPSPHRREGLR
jgi:hypothetical protein